MLADKEQISAQELKSLLEGNIPVFTLDVRSDAEYLRYHIKGALHIPIDVLSIEVLYKEIQKQLGGTVPNKVFVITYCNAGGRGGRSFILLKEQNNYSNIYIKNLTHGINEWIDSGYPIVENI